jgi:hypothetical protein
MNGAREILSICQQCPSLLKILVASHRILNKTTQLFVNYELLFYTEVARVPKYKLTKHSKVSSIYLIVIFTHSHAKDLLLRVLLQVLLSQMV